ncbi:MAG: lysophospholipid acyltransferase family protein [Arcticibacter sp.]
MKKILFLITKSLLYLLSLLPIRVLYLLSDVLYFFLYRVFKYRKKVVFENLQKSFPAKSPEEIQHIARDFYKFLCDQILESVKMLTISEETLKKHFRINNLDELNRHFESNKSVLAVTGHYGNWEWGALILSVWAKNPVLIVYKPISNKLFEGLINKVRSRFNAALVPMKSTLRKISQYKNDPYVAVLVSDQTPAKSEINYFTKFLNQQTPVFLGVEKLAKMTRDAVVYCHINRYKRGYYECTFETLFEEPHLTSEREITECYTRKLEENILKKPELWLWSHRRWKYAV